MDRNASVCGEEEKSSPVDAIDIRYTKKVSRCDIDPIVSRFNLDTGWLDLPRRNTPRHLYERFTKSIER